MCDLQNKLWAQPAFYYIELDFQMLPCWTTYHLNLWPVFGPFWLGLLSSDFVFLQIYIAPLTRFKSKYYITTVGFWATLQQCVESFSFALLLIILLYVDRAAAAFNACLVEALQAPSDLHRTLLWKEKLNLLSIPLPDLCVSLISKHFI